MSLFGKNKRAKGKTTWVTLVMGAAIVMVTGTVVADVVLTYTLNNGVGSTSNSPFTWGPGSNYGAAAAMQVMPGGSQTCLPGTLVASNICYQLTTVVNGVQYVPTTVLNAIDFNWTGLLLTTNPVSLTNALVTNSGAGAALPAGGCAFAFVSDAPLASVTLGGLGTPCASAPTFAVGILNTICTGATDAAGAVEINLATGANSGTFTCTIATGAPAGTALVVSYFVYMPTTVAAPLVETSIFVTPTFS